MRNGIMLKEVKYCKSMYVCRYVPTGSLLALSRLGPRSSLLHAVATLPTTIIAFASKRPLSTLRPITVTYSISIYLLPRVF
jgi:hypothetical protein